MNTTSQPISVETKADYKTVEGIRKHPLFDSLTEKQQAFLLAYIECRDREAAAKKVYEPKKAAQIAVRLMRNAVIRKLLSIYFGYEAETGPLGKKELEGLIAARLRNRSTTDGDFCRLIELLDDKHLSSMRARIRRSRTAAKQEEQNSVPLEEQAAEKIDEIVQQIEAQRKVNGANNKE